MTTQVSQFVPAVQFDPLDEGGSYRLFIETKDEVLLIQGPTMENGSVLVKRLNQVSGDEREQLLDGLRSEDDFGEFTPRSVVANFTDFMPGQMVIGQVAHLVSPDLKVADSTTPVQHILICRE